MALIRRSNARFTGSIWPGFVDALTALLLILMFVLSIFMIVQFSLRERITGQDQKLESLGRELVRSEDQVSALTNQLAQLSSALGLERSRNEALEGEVGTLRSTLNSERNEVSRLNAALSAMTRAREASDAEVARLSGALEASLSDAEALNLALAAARSEVDEAAEAARLAAARREALEAMVANLEAERTAQSARIVELDATQARTIALLESLQEEKKVAEARISEQEAARARDLALIEALKAREAEQSAQISELDAEKATALALISTLEAAQKATEEELSRVRDANAEALAQLEKLTAEQALALAAITQLEVDNQALTESGTELSSTVTDLQAQLDNALSRAATLGQALTAEEEARLVEAAAAESLRQKLAESADELDSITLALEEARAEAEQTLTLLAAAEAARSEMTEDALTAAEAIDREAALRALAEQELAKAESLTLAEQRKVAALSVQVRELNEQLGALQALLDDAKSRDESNQVQIAELGAQLNQALAQKVSELSRFRSEFFGRMQQVLGSQEGIQVVGDRFVFQSEVLFGSASAQLGSAGKRELTKLADIIRDVGATAPSGLNWILRVDGHTDRVPLSGTGIYRDNWELSQARALSVVRYLIEVEGVSPNRLAATGFGEYQPLDTGESPEALARNRRIEFKFTER